MRKDIVGESSSSVKLTHIRHVRSGTFQSSGYNFIFMLESNKSLSQSEVKHRCCDGQWLQARECVHVEEKILQRNITPVCKCKRRSYNVTSRLCASAREDLTT